MEPIYPHHVEETAKASEAGGQFAAMEAQGIPGTPDSVSFCLQAAYD